MSVIVLSCGSEHNLRAGGRKDFQTRRFFALDSLVISFRNGAEIQVADAVQ
jgi:hypothetical protein